MITEGTRLMLVDSDGRKFPVVAKRGMIEVRRLGVMDGDKLCDLSLGDRLEVGGRAFIVLRPSLNDLLSVMERRAQIITAKDSFLIPSHLDLGCGSRVLEAGVGSGALTMVLLKAVAPEGTVFSYELRADHADVARRNVEMSGYGACWEPRLGDVCKEELPGDLDAVALDMPNPWDALANAVKALRAGGHICCYVPNANQLEQLVKAMRGSGLAEVYSFETIQREMVVHEGGVRPSFETLGHTGYLAFGRKM
ncbi:MAG: tRNA (adenine-N1)-methyltransferase [Thermoplasmata archaeon]